MGDTGEPPPGGGPPQNTLPPQSTLSPQNTQPHNNLSNTLTPACGRDSSDKTPNRMHNFGEILNDELLGG